MRRLIVRTALPVVGLGLLLTACGNTPTASQQLAVRTAPEPAAAGDSILDSVIAADTIKCGVRNDLPGFSSTNEAGDHVGFDSDFCRVHRRRRARRRHQGRRSSTSPPTHRFTALQSGEIDVLVRNTTWTASRDGTEGATFLHPTFYDGQGMMVAADSGFESIDDMDGAIVCVADGTTTEGNVGRRVRPPRSDRETCSRSTTST